jgi:ankyrin repeat protein
LMAAAGNASTPLDTRGRYKTETQAIEAVEVLLAARADVNARDRNGQTALHGAAGWGWSGLVKTLSANRIDLFAKDARGRTAADIAKGSESSSGRQGATRAYPETEALLRQLMSASAPIASAGIDGRALDAPTPSALASPKEIAWTAAPF